MIRKYPAASRYSGTQGWLQYNFSFSFGPFSDPENMSFGPLRVFNDDYIQPGQGFGTHPHRDMEIVTFMVKGQLQHEDNTGGRKVLRPGEVQRMTAGTGILHSEVNSSQDEVSNSLQLWFEPTRTGLPPSYEQRTYDVSLMKNSLFPVVNGRVQSEEVTYIHQDLIIYMSELDAGRQLQFEQEPGRKIYVFVIEGALVLNHACELDRRDAARIADVTELTIESTKDALFMLMDLPA